MNGPTETHCHVPKPQRPPRMAHSLSTCGRAAAPFDPEYAASSAQRLPPLVSETACTPQSTLLPPVVTPHPSARPGTRGSPRASRPWQRGGLPGRAQLSPLRPHRRPRPQPPDIPPSAHHPPKGDCPHSSRLRHPKIVHRGAFFPKPLRGVLSGSGHNRATGLEPGALGPGPVPAPLLWDGAPHPDHSTRLAPPGAGVPKRAVFHTGGWRKLCSGRCPLSTPRDPPTPSLLPHASLVKPSSRILFRRGGTSPVLPTCTSATRPTEA